MGLFGKEPVDGWADDVLETVESGDGLFVRAERMGRRGYSVLLENGMLGMVGRSSDGLLFTLYLGTLDELCRITGDDGESTYGELAASMSLCTVGLDGDGDLIVSSVLGNRDCDGMSVSDMMYRWLYCCRDYEDAVAAMMERHGGGA